LPDFRESLWILSDQRFVSARCVPLKRE
jgi:hypothetical protein